HGTLTVLTCLIAFCLRQALVANLAPAEAPGESVANRCLLVEHEGKGGPDRRLLLAPADLGQLSALTPGGMRLSDARDRRRGRNSRRGPDPRRGRDRDRARGALPTSSSPNST